MKSKGSNVETNIAKKLWRNIMVEVHAELPNMQFSIPSGIIQQQICSRSGKLPIPGRCDGHINTEYFDDGTVPTENCNVHY